MQAVLLAVHMVIAVALIGLILIQRGKGADIGAAFGSGASQTVFGSQGSASFLTRATAVLATLFFVSSLTLGYIYSQQAVRKSVTEVTAPATLPEAPEAAGESAPVDVPAVPRGAPPPAEGETTP